MPTYTSFTDNRTFTNERSFHIHCIDTLLECELNRLEHQRVGIEHAIRDYFVSEGVPEDWDSVDLLADDDWIFPATDILCYRYALHTGDLLKHPGACNPFLQIAAKYSQQLGIVAPPLDFFIPWDQRVALYREVHRPITPSDYTNHSINVLYKHKWVSRTSQESAELEAALNSIYTPVEGLFNEASPPLDSDSDSDSDAGIPVTVVLNFQPRVIRPHSSH